MDQIIIILLLVISVVYNIKQYKELNSSKTPTKKSAYKKSWENGGKAKKNWKK